MTLRFEQISSKEKKQNQEEEERMWNFMEGKILFDYHYVFPSGEHLEATTDEDGQGHIVITKEEKEIFDFANLLPKDRKFVTPAYFQKFPEEETLNDYLYCDWGKRGKFVLLGDSQSLQELVLSLLHEIGHARRDKPEETFFCEKLEEELHKAEENEPKVLGAPDKLKSVYEILLNEEKAKMLSTVERRAWAEAIRMLRKIQRDTDIDFRAVFPSFSSSIEDYFKKFLGQYRRSFEWIIVEGYDPIFYKDLQKYFDRWQYEK